MTEFTGYAILVLLAVLVGAAIPALLQLRATLRSFQALLDETRPRLASALDEVTSTANRINRLADGIEERADHAKAFFDSAAELGRQIARVRASIQSVLAWGAALGPALAAAVTGFLSRGARQVETEPLPQSSPETGAASVVSTTK